jgi:flavin reductase (DIM6/NTAB) family NADH-FMN oxidoreductase RutF
VKLRLGTTADPRAAHNYITWHLVSEAMKKGVNSFDALSKVARKHKHAGVKSVPSTENGAKFIRYLMKLGWLVKAK